jgi:hypothetical protein
LIRSFGFTAVPTELGFFVFALISIVVSLVIGWVIGKIKNGS